MTLHQTSRNDPPVSFTFTSDEVEAIETDRESYTCPRDGCESQDFYETRSERYDSIRTLSVPSDDDSSVIVSDWSAAEYADDLETDLDFQCEECGYSVAYRSPVWQTLVDAREYT